MKYEIFIEPSAYTEIREAVHFVNNVSNIAGKELRNEIMSSIDSLKMMPNRHPIVEKYKVLGKDRRKMLIGNGRYFILYTVHENIVYIELFGDSRRKR